jgi:hypothetical protein
MGVSAAHLALGKALGQIPSIQWPIQLTPKEPFHLGISALVFVGPSVLSPADDLAQFGSSNPDVQEARESGSWFYAPYDGARVVAWFRPPELNRKYDIDFVCEAGWGGPFTLESSDGNSETVNVQGPDSTVGYATTTEHISRTVEANDHEWRWYALSCPTYWQLTYCELTELP